MGKCGKCGAGVGCTCQLKEGLCPSCYSQKERELKVKETELKNNAKSKTK